MAIAQVALAAGQAAVKYAPVVYDKASALLSKATGGKVTSPEAIPDYVGRDPRKLSVVAGALAMSGVSVNDIVPHDLANVNPQLAQIRATISGIATQMRGQYDNGSDRIVAATDSDTARDVLRRQRVEAVLNVYGNSDQYFLCHPTGGVPREDFAWFRAMGFPRSNRV